MDTRSRRIYEARSPGLVGRLTSAGGFTIRRAHELSEAWDAEAARRGIARDSPAYWTEGAEWIMAQPRRA